DTTASIVIEHMRYRRRGRLPVLESRIRIRGAANQPTSIVAVEMVLVRSTSEDLRREEAVETIIRPDVLSCEPRARTTTSRIARTVAGVPLYGVVLGNDVLRVRRIAEPSHDRRHVTSRRIVVGLGL